MAETFVRRDIWSLEEQGPWHPITLAYARALGVMQQRTADDSTSLSYQAGIHESAGGDWRQQCQHRCWYFLPWHRMYLYWFEDIVRATLRTIQEVDSEVAGTWALPYWNYGRGGQYASLPDAFRQQTLPDGTENPLYVDNRNPEINDGEPLPDEAIDPQGALDEPFFSAPQTTGGFGGTVTGKNHLDQDPQARPGHLERTPHNDVHGEVGGLMNGFDTAALDPVFWMHHANIDRLWVVWMNQAGHADPGEAKWTGEKFEFRDPAGNLAEKSVKQVLDTVADLSYTYEDTAAPSVRRRGRAPMRKEPPPEHPPELVGASEQEVSLTGDAATVAVPLAEPTGPAARRGAGAPPERAYLNVEGIEGDRPHDVVYGVYVNLTGDEPGEEAESHHVGNVSFFGIEGAKDTRKDHPAGHGLGFAFDVTDLVTDLRDRGRWDPARMTVTFAPLRPKSRRRRGAAERVAQPVRVGRVGLYYQ